MPTQGWAGATGDPGVSGHVVGKGVLRLQEGRLEGPVQWAVDGQDWSPGKRPALERMQVETGDRKAVWGPGAVGQEDRNRTKPAVCVEEGRQGRRRQDESPQSVVSGRKGPHAQALSLLEPSPGPAATPARTL